MVLPKAGEIAGKKRTADSKTDKMSAAEIPRRSLFSAMFPAVPGRGSRTDLDQYASLFSSQSFSSLMGTLTCSMVSRSRMVTALSAGVFSSPTVAKSTVMQ